MVIEHPSAKALLDEYSNYDMAVEIVCCWHSWFENQHGASFDHFPEVTLPHRAEPVTPDFLVTYEQEPYELIGEICRLPMRDDGFAASVEQARSYSAHSLRTDVMLLVPHAYADQAEMRMLDAGLLTRKGERVVVTSFVRDDMSRVTWWIFKRASTLRSVSYDDHFLGEESLHQKMTVTMEGLRVPLKYWRGVKTRFPVCNDGPPPLYIACVLWEKVLPQMLDEEDFLAAQVEKRRTFLILASPLDVQAAAAEVFECRFKVGWVRNALDLLVQARIAEKPDPDGRYLIRYGEIRVRGSEDKDTYLKLVHRLAADGEPEVAALDGQGELFGLEPQ